MAVVSVLTIRKGEIAKNVRTSLMICPGGPPSGNKLTPVNDATVIITRPVAILIRQCTKQLDD